MSNAGPLNLALPSNVNQMDPAQRQAAMQLESNSEVQTNWPYWSRLRLQSVLTGGGVAPAVYTIPRQVLIGFGYARGQSMDSAGRPGIVAQPCDTNITSAGETISGQNLYINNIGILLHPTSEPELAKLVAPEISVKVSLNGGNNQFDAGTLLQMPGGGGLQGLQNSLVDAQPLSGGRPLAGALSNGWGMFRNKMPVPSGLIWTRKGYTDSTLNVLVSLDRDVSFTTQLANEVGGNAAPLVTGVRGYTNPEAAAVYVDLLVILDALVINKRSKNQ